MPPRLQNAIPYEEENALGVKTVIRKQTFLFRMQDREPGLVVGAGGETGRPEERQGTTHPSE